jgi:hypothetical protein
MALERIDIRVWAEVEELALQVVAQLAWALALACWWVWVYQWESG